jgi:hypothetical protein
MSDRENLVSELKRIVSELSALQAKATLIRDQMILRQAMRSLERAIPRNQRHEPVS